MIRYVQKEELPLLLESRDEALKSWVQHKLDDLQEFRVGSITPSTPVYRATAPEYQESFDSPKVCVHVIKLVFIASGMVCRWTG